MKDIILKSIFFLVVLIISPNIIYADTAFDIHMNDFYSKSKEASLILKEIEKTLKEGSREKVCSRQKEAARKGILANKSIIKAFEAAGTNPPMESIKENRQIWENMLNECQ